MSDTFSIAFIVGFVVAFLAVCIVRVLYKKKHGSNCQYDERQILARNSAYAGAFFTLVAYCLLCMFLSILEFEWALVSVQMITGVWLSVLVFVIICIFKDAYFTPKGWTTTSFMVFSLFMCAIQTFSFVMHITDESESILTNGVLNESVITAVCAVIFFGFAVTSIIKMIMNKRVCEEE